MNEATSPVSAFPGRAVAAAAGLAAATLIAARPARAIDPPLTFNDVPGTGDVKVLNYALALEDLETELYVQAVQRLGAGGTGGRDAAPGTSITGLGVQTTRAHLGASADLDYYVDFGKVEQEHRDFLRGALGSNALPAGTFKFNFGIAQMTRRQVLDLVLLAEATGVSAYLGAITRFRVGSPFLQTAAAIQGTEARHTTTLNVVNNILIANGTLSGSLRDVAPLASQNNGIDRPQDPDTVLRAVSPFIVRG